MNKYVCKECGTENEEEYLYCKNCGAEIIKETKKEENQAANQTFEPNPNPTDNPYYSEGHGSSYNSQQNTYYEPNFYANPNMFYQTYGVEHIGGVPMEEIGIFVGKKANDILPKFAKMEIARTKASWCWPAAILGLLFGPLGSALWFFYRKMYKPAVIFSVIGAAVTVITSILTFGATDINFEAFFNSIASGNLEAAMNAFEESNSIMSMISSLISKIASWGACIISGIFAYHIYKLHCVEKIHNFKSTQADSRYYRFALSSLGGVSGGMLALGLIIMFGVSYLTDFIMTIGEFLLKNI